MISSYGQYKRNIKSDLIRYVETASIRQFIKSYLITPGFKYMFWHRTTQYLFTKNTLLGYYALWRLKHFSYKFGIQVSYRTQIGEGFYIGHFSNIVVSDQAIVGKNVNISQGVTIGMASTGDKIGAAVISDDVYIGPGAKLIGKIKVGTNVAIGANAVVTKDVPDNAVVVGVPARIISMKGAREYIIRKAP